MKQLQPTMLRIHFAIICMLLAGKGLAQHTYGSFYTKDAYVNYVLSGNKTETATIVMVPGLNLSSFIYATTPDGRKGWADLFADKGYDVYMVNDPKFDFATGGFVAPYTIPANGKAATPGSEQAWQSDIWRRWGFGTSQGVPYTNALFPTDSFAVFARNYPFLGSSNDRYEDAIQATMDSIGGRVWLMAHSAGAQPTVLAALQKKSQLHGLILIEPAGPPDSTNFPALSGLHMFGVYGDYISSRNQTNRKLATEAAAVLFQKAGGIADVVSLPEDSMVFGNSHILMQDRNSADVFQIIEHWLQQFSSNTLGIQTHWPDELHIKTYPNPAGNEIWIKCNVQNDLEYSIYTVDGRLLEKAQVLNGRIDLSEAPNGILYLQFKYNGQVVMKKLIKNG